MIKICRYCKHEFETKDKRQQYCNRKCSGDDRKSNKVTLECKQCGKEYKKYPSQVSKNNFCSRACVKTYQKENNSVTTKCDTCGIKIVRNKSHYKRTKNNYCSYECADKGWSKLYTGKDSPNFLNTYTNCSYCNKEIYRKKSEFKRSKNFFCTVECQSKWQSENIRGEQHPNYDKTLNEEDRVERRRIKGYWNFRESVYKRDNYTCVICGYAKGGILNAHHLNSYSWDKENRINKDNAVTLCEYCHKDFHSIYGNKNNTKKQFIKYYKDKAL